MQNTKLTSVDEYISASSSEAKPRLEAMRSLIKKVAPRAEEVVSYGMPAFKQDGMLVFYAVWKTHVGFYPSGSGIKEFADELSKYKTSKGAIQFPLDEKLPEALISKIVKFRLKQNEENAAIKALAKKQKK